MTRTVTTVQIVNNSTSVPPLYLNLSQGAPIYRVALTAGQLALVGSGGAGGYTYSATGLPAGLSLNTATGSITGTPTTIGHNIVTATVTDSATNTFTTTFTVDVLTRLIGTAVTPTAMEKSLAYSYTFAVSGATGAVTWSVGSGALPAGITLSSGGVLSGTATTYGTFAFTITATDAGAGDTLAVPFAAFVVAQPFSAGNFWAQAASLGSSRVYHTAIGLANAGLPCVVAVGGTDTTGAMLSSTEGYFTDANLWTAGAALSVGRYLHTATAIDSQSFLVAGGFNGGSLSTCYKCAISGSALSVNAAAPMTTARYRHAAVVLQSGKHLAVAGTGASGVLSSAELYDPSIDTWGSGGALTAARFGHTATLLSSGKVLVTGGSNGTTIATCELYDPVANTWSTVASMAYARIAHTATLLGNGKVLVVGGQTPTSAGVAAQAELYDPVANTWSTIASLNFPRSVHTATLLSSGRVLIAGGEDQGHVGILVCEEYDPVVGLFSTVGSLNYVRIGHTATLLASGDVFVCGGSNDHFQSQQTAEIYSPSALSDVFYTVGTNVFDNVLANVVTGGVAPYKATFANWTGGVPPPGLTFNGNGSVTGTPTAMISESVTVTYTDALGATATATLGIIVAGSRLQPQKSASNVGPQGATVINFEFPATGTPSVANDGTTMTVTIPNVTAAPVTSVTGTAPVAVSAGATPAISMAAATASVDGYLSHTDWGTFNAKQPALGYTAANDAAVVHLAGTETITGQKNFSANVTFGGTLSSWTAPNATRGALQCGNAALYFNNGIPTVCANVFFNAFATALAINTGSTASMKLDPANGLLLYSGPSASAGSASAQALVASIDTSGNANFVGSASATSHGTPTNALGTVGATATCNFTTSALNTLTLTSATNCTISFTAPANPCDVTVIVSAPASGTVPSVTWPATVNGTPISVTVLGKRTINRFFYDGSKYWAIGGSANGT